MKYVHFFKNCKFLFSPIWLGIKLFIYFNDVVQMVIIHEKIATFGYRQVVYLEIGLNLSIYYGYSQYFIVYIYNLA